MNRQATAESAEPDALLLSELEQCCRRETSRFRRTGTGDPRFCLEIFRRALATSTADSASGAAARSGYLLEDARSVLVQIYSEFIKAQINRKALHSAPPDDVVQQVWLRFWQAAKRGLEFHSLEGALQYLKQTTISVLLEEQRQARKRQRDESLQQLTSEGSEASFGDRGADLFEQHIRRRFRERCRALLNDPLEQRIFWLRYGLALPPRKIAQLLQAEGVEIRSRPVTARAVSDVLERTFRRLRADAEIRDLLSGD